MMFSPFAFFSTGSIFYDIVTTNLVFYNDPADGIKTGTNPLGSTTYVTNRIGNFTGSIWPVGTPQISVVNNNYYQGFVSTGGNPQGLIEFATPTIAPISSIINIASTGSYSVEQWIYYSSSMTSSNKTYTPLGYENLNLDREANFASLFNVNLGATQSIYFNPGDNSSVPRLDSIKSLDSGSLSNSYLNVWIHYVYTYNSSSQNATLYLNSVDNVINEVYNFTGAFTPMSNSNVSLFVGGAYIDGNLFEKGLIGPTRIYNAVLNQSQVMNNYNAEVGRFI